MPRVKKNTTPDAKPVTDVPVSVSVPGKTNLKSFLFRLRDICRNKGAQMDENGNIYADLIYDDLLFLKEVWHLADNGILNINKEAIINGFPITDIKLDTIASLKNGDQAHVGDVFKRLWTQLQRSNLKDIFDRDFALSNMLKDEKLKVQYLPLLTALLDYVGGVTLQDHEDTDPYEYFTKDLKKQKSSYFGQHYTPHYITESCVNEIQPKFGEIGLDPAAGTGKFMRTGTSYIHKHEPEHSEWEAFQYMRTVEIESKIYRQGVLASFMKYKQLPNMGFLRKGNSFGILPTEEEQVDYILANPPFGGTVDGFDELYYDTEMVQKGKRMVKKTTVKPTIIYPFQFVKKDTCVLFLQLIVNKLKNGGRAAVVFNGTIMNDSHRDVMKWFLDCCDLRKIIINPSGTFKCTGIETYTFIFWKGSPTQKIEYYEVRTKKKLGEFTRVDVEAKNWDIRPIFASKTTTNEIFTKMPLGDIITLHKGDLQATKCDGGEFPVMAISDKRTHSNYSVDGEYIYIASTSSGNSSGPFKTEIKYYNGKCGVTSLIQRIEIKDKIACLYKYLYYYLLFNKANIEKSCEKGVANKSLDKEKFLVYSFPLPSLPIQQEIVATLDRIFAPGTTDLADTLKLTDRAMDLVLKDPTGCLLEQVVEAIRLARDTMAHVARVKAQMAAVMKSVGSRGFEQKKIGDIAFGKKYPAHETSYGKSSGTYKFITGGEYTQLFTDTPDIREPVVIINRTNGLGKSNIFYSSCCSVAKQTLVLSCNDTISTKFLYFWLISNKKELENGYIGSNHKNLSNDFVKNMNIPIPPLDFQQSLLDRLESLESELAAKETFSKQSEDNARFILESYLNAA